VDVVEHEQEWTRSGDGFDQPPDRPERLVGRGGLGDTQQLREPFASELLVVVALQDGTDLRIDQARVVEVGEARCLLHDLDHGEVGDPVAVGQAPASEDRRSVAHAIDHLLFQA
jgi:hypothetical protein